MAKAPFNFLVATFMEEEVENIHPLHSESNFSTGA